jgi:hypothetical protein
MSKYKHVTATGQTFGEVMHHIQKQTTEQTKSAKNDYTRKKKHKNCHYDDWYPDVSF